jgi:hypothetical protein
VVDKTALRGRLRFMRWAVFACALSVCSGLFLQTLTPSPKALALAAIVFVLPWAAIFAGTVIARRIAHVPEGDEDRYLRREAVELIAWTIAALAAMVAFFVSLHR